MPRLGFVLILILFPISAIAWTRAADERIASKSAALAPPDLRMLLEKFESEYRRGLAIAQAEEGAEARFHVASSGRGRLRERIEKETRWTILMIREGVPMPMAVERLGVLAHLVADANNPFHAADHEPRLGASQADFAQYLERRLAKFPTVFYGLDARFHPTSYFDKTFARSARFYPLLREEYLRGGALRTSASFDDRSTAFGIASISYSRSVSDLVNLYYYIWKEAGGDVRSAAVMRGGNLLLHAKP